MSTVMATKKHTKNVLKQQKTHSAKKHVFLHPYQEQMAEEADDRDLMTSPSPGDDVVTIKLDRCYVPEFQVRSFAKALCPQITRGCNI